MNSIETDQSNTRPDVSALRIDPQHRTRDSSGKRLIIVLLLSVSVIGSASVMWFTRETPIEVVTLKLEQNNTSSSTVVLNASGYVTPRRRATISSETTGRIKELLVEEGMHVDTGQALAILDDTNAQAAYNVVVSDHAVSLATLGELNVLLENAEKNLQRIYQLKNRNFASQQQLDEAETTVKTLQAQLLGAQRQVAAAQARIAQMQRDLENYIVIAPFGGVVVSRDAQVGEIVSPMSTGGFTRTGIATIVDMSSLEIEVDVNESFISRISEGQSVEAVLDSFPAWKIPASVRTIIPTADRQKATIKVRIAFDQRDPKILPDMGVKVTFLSDFDLSTEENPLISLPRSAIHTEGNSKVVFLLKDGRLEKRRISIGQLRGQNVDIQSGITDGERIVIEAIGTLQDNVPAIEKK